MTNAPDLLRDALMAHLAAQLDAADRARDLVQYSNVARVTADLALVRQAVEDAPSSGVTPAERRAVADAVQRLSVLVWGSPDAPAPDISSVASLEHRVAVLAQRAGRWLARAPEIPG